MAKTVLLYGRSGSGKSTQTGVLAEQVYKASGGKKVARLYTADKGGTDPIDPYIELGVIEAVTIGDSDPWVWASKIAKGYIKRDGKWVLDKEANERVGLWIFESAHGIAKLMKMDMESKAADGINVGGDTNTTFSSTSDGETIKVGTTKGFQKFAIPQSKVMEAILTSQKLQGEYILWTAGVSKDDDEVTVNKIVGPDVLGRALTGTLPMEFNYTFRMDVVPAQAGKPPRHLLYLGSHQDVNSGNAAALGNIRRPLDAPPLTATQMVVEPANIVTALKLVDDDAKRAAKEVIKKRLGLK